MVVKAAGLAKGKGVFVCPQRQVLVKTERVRRLEPHLSNFLNEARMLADELQASSL